MGEKMKANNGDKYQGAATGLKRMLAHSGLLLLTWNSCNDPVGHPRITQTINGRMCDAPLTIGKYQLNKTILVCWDFLVCVRGVLCLLPFLLCEGGMCACKKPPKLSLPDCTVGGLKLIFACASLQGWKKAHTQSDYMVTDTGTDMATSRIWD